MPPPGEGELTGAHHAHGGAQVWDPDGGFGTQGSPDVRNHVGLQGGDTAQGRGLVLQNRYGPKLTARILCFDLLVGKSTGQSIVLKCIPACFHLPICHVSKITFGWWVRC